MLVSDCEPVMYTAAPFGGKLERLHAVIYSGNDQLTPRTGDNLGIVTSRGGGPALPNRSTSCMHNTIGGYSTELHSACSLC